MNDELTPEDVEALLTEQVERYLHMSLEEFERRAKAFDLPYHPAIPHLCMLAGLPWRC